MIDHPDKRIALLIDADNAPAGKIDVVLAEVARYGVANVRRAYGNWKSPHLKGWEAAKGGRSKPTQPAAATAQPAAAAAKRPARAPAKPAAGS